MVAALTGGVVLERDSQAVDEAGAQEAHGEKAAAGAAMEIQDKAGREGC